VSNASACFEGGKDGRGAGSGDHTFWSSKPNQASSSHSKIEHLAPYTSMSVFRVSKA
jgi:hypothetical protein